MSSETRPLLGRLKQPAYTGENRCIPCTVVNLGIAGVVVAIAGIAWPLGAVPVAVLTLGAIYFRGYLVPGTPSLTKRYVPDSVLERFGKAGPRDVGTEPPEFDVLERIDEEREHGVDMHDFVVEIGAVATETESDRRRVTADFGAAVNDVVEMLASTSVSLSEVAALFDESPSDVSAVDRPYPAYKVGIQIYKWPSETAFLTDIASHQILAERTDEWADVPRKQRLDMLQHFRSLRETCPACGDALSQSENAIDSCCHSAKVVILACETCGDRLLEADPESADLPQPTRL